VIRPDVDDVLAVVIETIEREIAPTVDDEHAASLCRTVAQLLRSTRARVAHEGEALSEDNRQLRSVLAGLRDAVPAPVAPRIDAVLADEAAGYRPVTDLQREAVALRRALVEAMTSLASETDDSAHQQAIRGYLHDELERQRPWLVDAYTGPRR